MKTIWVDHLLEALQRSRVTEFSAFSGTAGKERAPCDPLPATVAEMGKITLKFGNFSHWVAKCILHMALGISFTAEEDRGKKVWRDRINL